MKHFSRLQQDKGPSRIRSSRTGAEDAEGPIQRSLSQRITYDLLRCWARLVGSSLLRVRCEGRHRYPTQGAALICSNHQSNLDPFLVGLSCDRQINYLARQTLFKFGPLARFMRYLNAIPIDREGYSLAGLRATLQRLRSGELVLIFPEGTRTPDGRIQALKPGFCTLARRAAVPLVPVAIEGAYQAWPRSAPVPQIAVIHICVGPLIEPALQRALSDEQLVAELQRRIGSCHQRACQARRWRIAPRPQPADTAADTQFR